jgi:hypothetical protein
VNSLLPIFLIQALLGLGGVCFILGITIFHYFNQKVEQHTLERMRVLFSSPETSEFIKTMKKGDLPFPVMKEFIDSLIDIAGQRRRFRSLLVFFPLSGCLFILSASFASVSLIEGETARIFAPILESSGDLLLLVGIALVLYCGFQLVKLCRELA